MYFEVLNLSFTHNYGRRNIQKLNMDRIGLLIIIMSHYHEITVSVRTLTIVWIKLLDKIYKMCLLHVLHYTIKRPINYPLQMYVFSHSFSNSFSNETD